MKGLMLGVVGVGGVGAAAYMGGPGGPNDYVGHVAKSPQAVYAAFSELGPAGEISMPTGEGWGTRVIHRVIKVPNEQVKLELLVDDEPLLTAEVQMEPEGEGTRVAAEIDFNQALVRRLVEEAGGPEVPAFAFQEFLIDQAFSHAMGEMVARIEEGRPLLSLAETHDRWGRGDNGDGTFSERPSIARSRQHQAVQPQLDARPALDPNAAARRPVGSSPSASTR